MKAYVLHHINDFQLEETSVPIPAEQEVLVRVKAAGICGSDIPRIYKTGAHKHPLILGHEFSGTVVKLGQKVDQAWSGQRVGVFPLIPCGSCVPCQKTQYEMCRNYDYLGSRCNGGFAEYVTVPERNLLALPESVSYEEAAMLEPMAVAAHAMRRMGLKREDRIVICGLGTIGLLLLMLLEEAGFDHVLAIGNKDFQKNTIIRMGIHEKQYCDSRNQKVDPWIMAQTNNRGADVFFECVGKNETLTQAVHAAAPAGKVMLVGNPYSDMKLDQNTYWKILRNQLTIAGSWNSSFAHSIQDDWHYVLKRLEEKRIAPAQLITHRFSLEELKNGFSIMRNKAENYIKIMGIL